MSARHPHVDLVLEWTPRGIWTYDARTARTGPSTWTEVAGRSAIVAIGRRSAFVRTVRVPNASPEEIRAVLRMRLAELFPVADLAFDFHLSDDITAEGRLALVAAVPSVELRRVHQEAKAANVRVVGVVPAGLGSVWIAREGTAAVVQPSADGTAIDVVAQGLLRQSRVASLPSIEAEVCRTYSLAGIECGSTVAAGGMAVAEADIETKETALEAIHRHQDRLGLSLELPEAVAARQKAAETGRQRTAVLFALAALALGTYTFLEYSDAQAEVDRKDGRTRAALKRLNDQKRVVETEYTKTRTLQDTLTRAFRPPQRFGDVTVLVSNRTPAGVWLTGITVERGKPLSVRGTARTNEELAAYLRALSSEPRLRDVKLVFANNSTIEETPVVQFSLSAFPVGNLPLVDPKRTNTRRTR